MLRTGQLSTRAAVDALVTYGVTLPRIAGLAQVPVPAVRAIHAGAEPPPMVALTLRCAARIMEALVPFNENEPPIELLLMTPMSAAEARRAVAALRAAGFTWQEIAARCGARHYQIVQRWAAGRAAPSPEYAERLRSFAWAVRAEEVTATA